MPSASGGESGCVSVWPLAQQGVLGLRERTRPTKHFLASHCGQGQSAISQPELPNTAQSMLLPPSQTPPACTHNAHLLDGADGDPSSAGHHDVPTLHVSTDLVQDKWDDMWLHGQEEHVTVPHSLLVVGSQVHSHLLQGAPVGTQPANMAGRAPSYPPQAESLGHRRGLRLLRTGTGWGGVQGTEL